MCVYEKRYLDCESILFVCEKKHLIEFQPSLHLIAERLHLWTVRVALCSVTHRRENEQNQLGRPQPRLLTSPIDLDHLGLMMTPHVWVVYVCFDLMGVCLRVDGCV